jgi:ABC-type amino acid transport substrate-binding protein
MKYLILLISLIMSVHADVTIGVSDKATNRDLQIVDTIKETYPDAKIQKLDLIKARRAISSGEMDAYVGHVTITPVREVEFDFSNPYQDASLQLLVGNKTDYWNTVTKLLPILFFFALAIICFGTILYFAERASEEKITNDWHGYFNACYMASIVSTTVGLGDISCHTKLGKTCTVIGSFFAISMYGWCFASISNSMDYVKPKGNYAVVQGSTSEDYVNNKDIVHRKYKSVESAVLALREGEVSGVLYDGCILEKYVKNGLVLLEERLQPQYYGVLLKEGSELRESINRKLK